MSLINRNFFKNLSVFLIGLFISFLILEIFLRIYNPFGFRIKGDKIILYPYTKHYVKSVYNNKPVIHTKNSLGFRGSEPPKNFSDYITIVAVGGSTTECFYLNDGKTWPELIEKKLKPYVKNIWVNNAGIDGQTTFGHIILLKDYILKLKPKIVMFYCGLNDLGITAPKRFDKRMYISEKSLPKKVITYLAEYSEVFATVLNLANYYYMKKINFAHGVVDVRKLKHVKVSKEYENEVIQSEKKYLEGYEKRLKKLIKICRENNIEPVFITQEILCDNKKDISTGVYLGDLEVNNKYKNCSLFRKVLNLYNTKMIEVAKKYNVFYIDAASLMPPDSEYYYDTIHFTEKGSEKFADVITPELLKYLQKQYNQYIRK